MSYDFVVVVKRIDTKETVEHYYGYFANNYTEAWKKMLDKAERILENDNIVLKQIKLEQIRVSD